jgi:putative restriction endonuclease
VPDARDLALRQAALQRARTLQDRFDDLIPVAALREGFEYAGTRVSFGSFFNGIYRPKQMQGPAALTINTASPKQGRPPPYEDTFDEVEGRFTYRFRDPGSSTRAALLAAEADNRALLAAFEHGEPLLYFRGIFPGQYSLVAPAFITSVDRAQRTVDLEAALPMADLTEAGLVSTPELRRYATREAAYRLHQHRFRAAVLTAYRRRCAVCALKEAVLLQAAHIIEDRDPRGIASVVNGIALCAIHHLAYDRNVMGINPDGVVHISQRVLDETDGPMLKTGIQGFHLAEIAQPKRPENARTATCSKSATSVSEPSPRATWCCRARVRPAHAPVGACAGASSAHRACASPRRPDDPDDPAMGPESRRQRDTITVD